ncbi:helix-turn-helix domain-containing protein [Streptomyces scopuliridis]|uniref:helix-turn-helix domain-containing protein n=1 Tax=Streptomyces scopuliridis TaxID=452529 RepID=UPI0036D0F0CF
MHEDPLAELALRLRTLRAQRGLQMGGLQQRTGLGRTTVSQALNGQVVPSEATLVALANALGTDVEPHALRTAGQCPAAPALLVRRRGGGHPAGRPRVRVGTTHPPQPVTPGVDESKQRAGQGCSCSARCCAADRSRARRPGGGLGAPRSYTHFKCDAVGL